MLEQMGLSEAKDYIKALHALQDDPYRWPDFLTGLPDRTAVLRKIHEVYGKRRGQAVSLVRLVNVEPYLIKYGSTRHVEIIQWAAAILRTTAAHRPGAFVGVLGTHEFALICKAEDADALLKKANQLFRKKSRSFYGPADLKAQALFSYVREGRKVRAGLMDMAHATLRDLESVEISEVIPSLLRDLVLKERDSLRE